MGDAVAAVTAGVADVGLLAAAAFGLLGAILAFKLLRRAF